MKKKNLLVLLPALLVLASCNASPKAELKPGLDNIVEDTFAHEEIFGKTGYNNKNIGIHNRVNPVEDSAPAIGVQCKEETIEAVNYISIRFVAAVDFGSTVNAATAKWYRTMFGTDGHVLGGRAETEMPCSKAYTSLYDDDEDDKELTIDEFNTRRGGTTYTHFVVYTMTGIPKASYANCYLTAYLSVDVDGEGAGEAVNSKVVATTVDQKTQFSFSNNNTGCFGVKITGEGSSTFNTANYTRSGYWATFENISLDAGDLFLFANRAIDGVDRNNDFFAVYGFDLLREADHEYDGHPNGFYEFTRWNTSQFSVCPYDMSKYYFYVQNDTNKIFPKYSVTKTVTLNPGVWDSGSEKFAMYMEDFGKGGAWYDLKDNGASYSWEVTNVPDDAEIIFCRINPNKGHVDKNWYYNNEQDGYGVWNESAHLGILSTGNNTYTISGWGNYGQPSTGSWGA